MLRRFFNWKDSTQHRSSNRKARSHSRRQTLSRIAALAAESLEPRTVMAAFTYVDDSWTLNYDVDQSGGLSNGDIVTSGEISATYGSTAFGTVIDHAGVSGSQTIADAVSNTDVGGTLRILAGNYSEDVAIAKSLAVKGDGVDTTTLTGNVAGLTITGLGEVAIHDLQVTGATTGIQVDGSQAKVAVFDSRIVGNDVGIEATNGGTITGLTNNDFESTANNVDVSLTLTAGPVTIGSDNKFGATQFFVDNQSTLDVDLTAAGNTFQGLGNFDIEDKVHHAVDTDLAVTTGVVTWVAGNIYVTNPAELGSTDSSIQRGIDAADAGFNVNVEAGTYAESINVNKQLALVGAGNGNDSAVDTILAPVANNGILLSASGVDATTRLVVSNLRVQGATGDGIKIVTGGGSFTTIGNVVVEGSSSDGVEIGSASLVQDLQILDSQFSNNSIGLRVATIAAVDGLAITNSVFSNNQYGIEQETTTSGIRPVFTNVELTGVSLLDNAQKGGYFERLSNATFSGLTVTGNGTAGNNNVAGIDLNLKYENFSNISIEDSTFGDNATGHLAGRGPDLIIKARNDGASYSGTPATLSNLNLKNVTFSTGAGVGLSLGNDIDFGTTTTTGLSFQGNGTGVVVYGNDAGQTFNLNDTSFTGTATYIENGSPGVEIDATGASFDGVVGADATLGEAFTIVDKILDAVDLGVATAGLVRIHDDQVFVTTNSYFAPLTTTPSIQRGVDAASGGDTVHVAAGEYVDNLVNINKQITLSGANAGLSAKGQANRDARGPETLLRASTTGAAMGITVTAAGATIDGIAFLGAGLSGGSYAHITVLAQNLTVSNVISNSNLSDPFQPGGNALGIVTGYGQNFDGLLVENSFFARQRAGIFVNPGSGTNTIAFDGNEFAARTAVNHDLGFTSLNSTFTNNLFDKVNVDGYDYGPATGVNVAVVPNGGSVVFTGNQVASNFIGLDLKDVQSGGTVSFTDNTFTDHTGPAAGVRVNAQIGATVTFTSNTFTNGGAFVWNVGPAGLDLSTGGNQVDVGNGPVDLASADRDTAFATADRVIDGIDVGGAVGMVRLQAGKVFVTPNSFLAPTTTEASIQRGVDYASVNDEVHVAAGTYTVSGPIVVNKTVSLLGAQAGVDARTRSGDPETVVDGAGGSFSLGADNIVLDGFTLQGATGAPLGTAVFASPAASGHQIRNNIIQNNVIGLYFGSNGLNQSVVEQNLFQDNNNPGPAGGTALYSDSSLSNALIQNNTFTGDNFTAAVNLLGSSSAVTDITISGNAFETGNQLVLFNVDNSLVSDNTFSGVLAGGTGSGVYIGGGVDNLTVSGNTFTDRGSSAISASDAFSFGANTNLNISNNTITQDVSVLEGSRSLINLTDVQGVSQVTGNAITLSGTLGTPVDFVNAINVTGSATGTVNVSSNDLLGVTGGDSAGVRLNGSLGATAVVNVANNKINGFDHGVLADALAAGVDVNIHGNDLSGNALFAVKNGAGALLDASGNWLGSNVPASAAAAVSGLVDYSPWLNSAADSDNGARGFIGDFSVLNVDNDSPQAPGFAGHIDEALSLLANNGTLFLHSGTYNENVNTAAKAVTLELGNGTAGVTINGSLTLDANDTLRLDLGTLSSDQLEVTGNMAFGGATLNVTALQPLTANSLLLLNRRGTGNDTFGNVAQGDKLVVGGQTITARYDLGDGNDFGFLTASNPVLSDITGPLTYVENASPVLLAPNVNLSDLDNTTMDGGSLQVLITSGGNSSDRIWIRNQGTGAGQIGVSGNNVTYGGVLIGTYTGGVGTNPLLITFTNDGAATLAAVQALLRNLTFYSVTNWANTDKEIAFLLQDGSGGVGAAVQNIDTVSVADAPVIAPGGVANYTENSAPVVIAPSAIVYDADNVNFAGGTLTVQITNNAESGDQLGIRSVGTGAGQISVVGSNIYFEGNLIGSFTSGTGTTPMVISLNSAATVAATRALLQAITFSTPGDAPVATYRTVTFQLDDGAGGVSAVASKLVRVIAVNDAPTVGMQLARGYEAGAAPVVLAPNSTVTDPDSWSFDTATLTVTVVNADSGDRLSINSVGTAAGQISISGSNVLYGGIVIGTFTGGSGTTPLVVSFNASATRAGAQAVVRSIAFATTTTAAPRYQRQVEFVLTDGDGGTSDVATKPVYITPPAAATTLASTSVGISGGQTVSYSRGATNVSVLPQGLVTGNPANGKLTIANTNGQATDRLTIGGRFSVNQGKLLLNGIVVGTVNTGGTGKTALVVTLNGKATQTLVQELVRSIKFRASAQAATTARAVSVTLAANGATASTWSTIKLS